LCTCTGPVEKPFSMPHDIDDLRARLLQAIPEGRDIDGARGWMRKHGFRCEEPLPSATEAHATVCRPREPPADAGYRAWTVILYDRNGRLADVLARP
jgi:hypothetical protein